MKRLTFVLLVLALTGCGKPTAEESFKKGDEAAQRAAAVMDTVKTDLEARLAFRPAVAAFEELIANHPNDPLAEPALFRIANIRNNFTREPQEAVDTYKRYIATYPNGQQTELSMFLVGFLYNNQLHNLDSAAAAYTAFLAKYPESQYATSARFELSTLGKPLEDLLPKSPIPEKPAAPKKHPKKTPV
jgi:outer membrane protein assembly factor BamD (BamD/ComL family)